MALQATTAPPVARAGQAPQAAGGLLAPESFEAAAAVLMDAETDTLLFAKEPHRQSPPASMVKMMLALIVLEQIQAGTRKLDEPVRTSPRAEGMGGSQVYLKRGEVFSLEDMLRAVMIGSANDASVAVAEHVAGSVEGFVDLMNARGQDLGLKDTRFATPHGLPPAPGQEGDLSSPHDMALLVRALARHPQALEWGGTRRAPFREGKFIMWNPNLLLGRFPGIDGMKTGHFTEAGFNLAATAEQGGFRLVAVVMGEPNSDTRFNEAARLLNWGFNVLRREIPVRAGEEVGSVRVRGGVEREVKLVTQARVILYRQPGEGGALERDLQVSPSLSAPVQAGQQVGVLMVKRGSEVVGKTDVVAAKTVPQAPLWQRLLFFWR